MELLTVNQVCIEADNNKSRKNLYSLLMYIDEHQELYPPHEYRFMHEHITKYISEVDQRIIQI